METLKIAKRRLNNNQHNIVRLRFSTQEVYLSVVNEELQVGANITDRFIDINNKNKGTKIDVFGRIVDFTVGKLANEDNMIDTRYTSDSLDT